METVETEWNGVGQHWERYGWNGVVGWNIVRYGEIGWDMVGWDLPT